MQMEKLIFFENIVFENIIVSIKYNNISKSYKFQQITFLNFSINIYIHSLNVYFDQICN